MQVSKVKPDFFIVGAPKSATTALNDYLGQHPDVFMSPAKELHFFGTDLDFLKPARNFSSIPRSPEELRFYLSFFDEALPGQVLGESSVWYLYSECAAREIREFNSGAKIIIMLRNPVDFLYSLHGQFLWEGNEDIESFREALLAEDDRRKGCRLPPRMHFQQGLQYREVAGFSSQVNRYLETFEEDQVLITLLDDWASIPAELFAKVTRFLGVAEDFSPDFRRVNASKETRSTRLQDQLMRPDRLVRTLSKAVPRRIRPRVRARLIRANTKMGQRPQMDERQRKELAQFFRSEVLALQDLIKRDLSSWL